MFLLLAFVAFCGDCHQEIVERFAQSPMGRTSGPVDPADNPPGVVLQPASQTRFEIVRTPNTLDLYWGKQVQPLPFFIGSGRMGRSYAFLDAGYLYQAPVGYYATRRAWDMAPGYETDKKPDLSRPVTEDCLFCHASGARAIPGTVNRIADTGALRGVTCERCHGEGAEHAARPRRDNIINPKSLAGSARDSVCEQCHLAGEVRLPLPGNPLADYRPGAQLGDFLQVFVNSQGPAGIQVNGHSEALAQSRCRQASAGKLWCGTCHDPHTNTADYREKCLQCHETRQCPSLMASTGDCIGCHMPKARAFDGGHTVFTDHSIPRRPSNSADRRRVRDLRPYFNTRLPAGAASRNLGLAYSEVGRREHIPDLVVRAWPYLREAVAAGLRDPALLTRTGLMLQADGRKQQAIEYYRRSLAIDGNQMEALLNLANLTAGAGNGEEATALRKKAFVLCPRCVSPGPN